jgi:hypothetical protein
MTTHSELLNLALFARAITKTALLCGFVPGALLAFFGPRVAKYWCDLSIGHHYRVEGCWAGDFAGEVLSVDRDLARIRVTDPMRIMPRVRNRCCFPQCVLEDLHDGDHEFMHVREGVVLAIPWRLAKWIPIANRVSEGERQLAKKQEGGIGRCVELLAQPAWATSRSPRKARTA